MSYQLPKAINLGSAYAGAVVTAQLVTSADANTGVPQATIDKGNGKYRWLGTVPNGFLGWVDFIVAGVVIVSASIAPADEVSAGAVGGSGSRAVTLTVTGPGAVPIQNATVRMTTGGNTFTAVSNSSGVASFSLDDATYTLSITASGYSFTPASKVVDASHTAFPVTMTAISISAAANPADCTCYLTNYAMASTYTFELVSAPGSPIGGYPIPYGVVDAAAAALVQKAMPQGSTGRFRRGNGQWTTFTVPTAATFALPTVTGDP